MHIDASPLLLFGFMALTMVVVAAWFAGIWVAGGETGLRDRERSRVLLRAGVGTVGWMIATLLLAASGVLLHFEWRPPLMPLLLGVSVILAVWVGASSLGARLAHGVPLAALVGFHAFRWPLELLMHRGYVQGFVPVQMTYAGRNFDVVTGITAAVLGLVLARTTVSRVLVLAWNVLGIVLLANVLVIAVASMPMFRAFGPDRMNVWVAVPPFVWLPTVLVVAALGGHIVVFRRLAATS